MDQAPIGSIPAPNGGPLNAPAPEAAFGANILGQGLGELGKATGEASQLLSQRALALQTINNQNIADKATGDWATGLAQDREGYKKDLLAGLSANPGMDTQAFLGSFLKDQESKRSAIFSSLPSPAAQQLFNQDSRRLALITATAMASETQSAWRESTIATAKGAIQLNQGAAIVGGGDPSNPVVAGALGAIASQTHKLALLHGLGGDAETALLQSSISPIYEGIFKQQIDNGNLEGARAIFTAHAAHDLTPEAISQMGAMLRTANGQDMIRSPVSQIYDQGTAPSLKPSATALPIDTRGFLRTFTLPHEGSATVTDSNGALVQFGINQASNPDLSVGHLTEGQAADRLATYARPDLSGPLANAYTDTAIMTGKAEADKLLAAAGGDVNKFIDLRKEFQANLASSNPDRYGKYAATWASRSEDLRNAVGANSAPPITFPEAPPKFSANADPADIRDQMLSYNERAASYFLASGRITAQQADAFRNDANSRATLMANIANDHQHSIYNQLDQLLVTGTGNGQPVRSVNDLPPSLFSQLSPSYQTQIAKQINLEVQGAGAFKTPQMTQTADALTGLVGKDPNAFLNTDLTTANLGASDYQRLALLQGRMRTSAAAKNEQATKLSALEANPIVKQIVANSFSQTGPDADTQPTKSGAWVQSPAHLAYLGALQGEVEKTQALQPEKPLTQDQIGTIARGLMVTRANQTLADYRAIPVDAQAAVAAAFQRQYKRAPSPQELTHYYYLGRGQ